MPWVRFSDDFNYRAKRGVVIAYKPGMEENVTTRCAREARGLGKAVSLQKKSKDAPLVEVSDDD